LEINPSSQHFGKKEQTMLVLSRKLNEKIVIDGGIVLTVVKIDRNQVRLGIEAPSNVRIFREEIVASPDREPADRAMTQRPVAAGV
jgi:carbon storage regulator